MKDHYRYARGGFTLVECTAAMLVLSVAVLAVVEAISVAQSHPYEALHTLRAHALAEALADEIIALPYADPQGGTTVGPDSGETGRANFDNCDDFDGFADSAGALADAQAITYSTVYQRFNRSVTASYGTESIAGLGGTTSGLTTTVTVTDDLGRTWVVTRFITEPAS